MKPFDLEKALAGEPVQLRDGRRAEVDFKIPDELVFSSGLRPEYPLLGFIYKRNGELHHIKYWSLDGGYMLGSDEDELDIVGLWEEREEGLIMNGIELLQTLVNLYKPSCDEWRKKW